MRIKGILAAAIAGLTVGAALSGPARAETVPITGAIFNDPKDSTAAYAIVNRIISLIRGTPGGAEISVAMYVFDDMSVANELIAAKNRGVRVRVVVDAKSGARSATQALGASTGLGKDTSQPSWLKICATGYACVSGAPSSVNPINHNKFYLFSSTSGANRVVLQSSANLTSLNTVHYWNNAVQVVDNGPIYDAYRAYFGDLAKALHNDSDYYRMTNSPPVKSYFFPRAGTTSDTDTIVEVLNNVTCPGNSVYGTVDHYTKIRIAAYNFTREPIAYKLRDLANKNWVDIVYGNVSSGSLSALDHSRIKLYKLNDGNSNLVHSKYMTIEGTYAGYKDTKWVWTGSHNYDDSSLRENDEALLRINSVAIHDQYRQNFWDLRAVVRGY